MIATPTRLQALVFVAIHIAFNLQHNVSQEVPLEVLEYVLGVRKTERGASRGIFDLIRVWSILYICISFNLLTAFILYLYCILHHYALYTYFLSTIYLFYKLIFVYCICIICTISLNSF